MNKKGKIAAYQPDGVAEIKGINYNRFKVTFADGEWWKFLAKGDDREKRILNLISRKYASLC